MKYQNAINIIEINQKMIFLKSKYSNSKCNDPYSSNIKQKNIEQCSEMVISVWSGEFNEKEYANRWCISRRNKGFSY